MLDKLSIKNFIFQDWPGPECRILIKEKKELRFDSQTKRKKFAMIQALFALSVIFFCKTSVYLFIAIILILDCHI